MTETSSWIPVGALAEGFAPEANTLPTTTDLAGKTLDLHFDNGWVTEHRFVGPNELVWTIKDGPDKGQTATETYVATTLRDGFYFVDFIKSGEQATSVSLVLDMPRGIFTAVIGRLPTEVEAKRDPLSRVESGSELTPVTALFAHGTIDRPYSATEPLHQPTEELVGKRVLYEYSSTEEYEHIYLNTNLYTWHCIKGVEKALADTDACRHYKIDDKLYLFVWREKIIPTIGVIMIDLKRGKTTGKIMGYQGQDFGKVSNFQVGALARVLNVMTYDS
jgi:hypothetical protein